MIDYKALAGRVAQRAIYADNNADPNNKTWAADLRTVVSLLNDIAGQKPFAWAIRDGWSQTRFSVDPDTPILGTRRADYVVDALYLHPAPAAPAGWKLVPVEPTPEMLASTSWPGCAGTDYAHMLAAAPAAPQAEPKREPLTALRILEIEADANRKWRDNGRIVEYAVVFARMIESAHGIGGSDAE